MKKKTCKKCGEEFPLDAFSKHLMTRDGKHPYCKRCDNLRSKIRNSEPHNKIHAANLQLQRNYGITAMDKLNMLDKQHGRCAICGSLFPDPPMTTACVDHCHTTGQVRELLCFDCNIALSHLENNIRPNFHAFMSYLHRHEMGDIEW